MWEEYNKQLDAEWYPILTPKMSEYAWVRVRGHILQIKLAHCPSIITQLDAKAIPQLIKILKHYE